MTAQLTPDEASELRILLMMRIRDCWRLRHTITYYRSELRCALQILRKLRTII